MNYELSTTIYPKRLSSPHSQKVLEVPSITLFRSLSALTLAKADAFCAFFWLKNLCNPRLINDLRALGIFTTVKDSLQNKLFMQNKANFQKVKLNVNTVLTKDYDQLDTWSIGKTKPIQSQLKPIQSQFKPIKCQNKANQSQLKPIKCQNKANTNPTCRGVASGEAGNKANPLAPKPCRFGRAVVN